METVSSVLTLITPGCSMSSIYIKDAYYSVPIDKDSQKCFKFLYNGQLYKFICLPNGFVHRPRKFTKLLLKAPLVFLRRLNHILAGYIDDIINVGDDFSDCLKNVSDTILVLHKLGLVVHPDKFQFLPVQEIKFLGFIIRI